MNYKQFYSIISILIIILSFSRFAVIAQEGQEKQDPFSTSSTETSQSITQFDSETLAQVLTDTSSSAQGSTTEPVTTESPNGGGDVTVNGAFDISSGVINSADYVDFMGASFTNVNDFHFITSGYTIGSVNLITTNSITVTNAKGVTYQNSVFNIESASSVAENGVLRNKEYNIEISHAQALNTTVAQFQNVNNTSFQINPLAVEAMPKNGTVLEITDSAGNAITFKANGNDSKIILSKAEPPIHFIQNGILSDMNGNAKESISTNSTAVIKMGNNGIGCMELNSVATYRYSENTIKDFAINIPPPIRAIIGCA